MVGGLSYKESQFNRATDARRQPGSTIKPLIYALAIEQGYRPLDTQHCTHTDFAPSGAQPYTPRDYGANPYHERLLTMREALAASCNVSAVAWLQTVGAGNVVDLARRTGVSSPLSPTPSLALGCYEMSPLELCGIYSTLAAGGVYRPPVAVLRVVGPDGRVIHEYQPHSEQAISAGASYIVTDMLKGVLQAGGTGARIGSRLTRPAAAKTGSTEGSRDAWFAGYTPDLAMVVWVGYDDNEALSGGGAALAGPVWRDALEGGLTGIAKRDFTRPRDVVTANVCTVTGLRVNFTCLGQNDLLLAAHTPDEHCGQIHWERFFGINPPQTQQPGAPGEPTQPPTGGNLPRWLRPKKR
jgi:penicillin-binding protein 2D